MNDAAQTKDTMDQHAQEMVVEKKACGDWRESQQAVADALTRLNALNSDPAATAADRQLATQQLDSARSDERAAQAAYRAAHAQRMATQRQVQNTVGKDLNYEVECK
jgi:ferric-dicitrate binding protein FerR (iron transport regulator)